MQTESAKTDIPDLAARWAELQIAEKMAKVGSEHLTDASRKVLQYDISILQKIVEHLKSINQTDSDLSS